MPLFITDSELQSAGSDVSLVAERADAYILDLSHKLEAMKSRVDALAITSEQWCSVVEQKFLAISAQFREMENTKTQLENTLQSRSAELSQAQAQVHKLELELVRLHLSCFCFEFKLQVQCFSIYIYRQCNSFRCTFTEKIHLNWI